MENRVRILLGFRIRSRTPTVDGPGVRQLRGRQVAWFAAGFFGPRRRMAGQKKVKMDRRTAKFACIPAGGGILNGFSRELICFGVAYWSAVVCIIREIATRADQSVQSEQPADARRHGRPARLAA